MREYIGVDVSKQWLDICFKDNHFHIANNGKALGKWIKTLQVEQAHLCVVCEASGGYEKGLLKKLNESEIECHVAHANKVRAYAKARGVLAKTDKIDARLIADYARAMEVTGDVALSENAEKIRELLKRREQLQADKKRERQRLDKVSGTIKTSLSRHIKWLDKEIKSIDKQLEQTCVQDKTLMEQKERYMSVPAVGDMISYYLLAHLPELGETSHKRLAALVGVAPYNRDSGTHSGKRYIMGGRKSLRSMLYMCAVASLRWNPEMKQFYDRLREAGKPVRVALVVVIRKLVSLLNSLAKRQTTWQKNLQHSC